MTAGVSSPARSATRRGSAIEVRDPAGRGGARRDRTSRRRGVTAHAVRVHASRTCSPGRPTTRISTAIRAGAAPRARLKDDIEDTFGFRTIETRDGKFYLNGEPLYLRAALDQDYYPDTICTVPSVEFLEDQFRKAKELGLNCLRCHIKAADPRYYEVADRMGMLIWTELPNGGMATDRSRGRKEKLLKGIVDRDVQPSVHHHLDDHQRELGRRPRQRRRPPRLAEAHLRLAQGLRPDAARGRQLAAWRRASTSSPTSPTITSTPPFPDHRDDWDEFVDELAERAAWLYCPHGDAVITGREPLMCSEFGNWGLPYPKDLRDADGAGALVVRDRARLGRGRHVRPRRREPLHRLEPRPGVRRPAPLRDRRAVAAVPRPQIPDRVDAAEAEPRRLRHHRAARLPLGVERPPRHARNPRVFHELFHIINADTVIVPRWERLSYWGGETASVRGLASRTAPGADLEGAHLEISLLRRERVRSLPRLEAPSVLDLGTIELARAGVRRAVLAAHPLRAARPGRPAPGAEPHRSRRCTRGGSARSTPASSSGRRTRTSASTCGRSATRSRGPSRSRRSSSRARTTRLSPTHVRQGASLLLAARGRDEPLSVLPALAERQGVRPATARSGRATGPRPSPGCAARGHFAGFPSGRCSTRPSTG